MFWLRNKKINFLLHSLNSSPETGKTLIRQLLLIQKLSDLIQPCLTWLFFVKQVVLGIFEHLPHVQVVFVYTFREAQRSHHINDIAL